jgi:predicted dehydrogenase
MPPAIAGDRVRRVRAFQRNLGGSPNPDVAWAFLEFAGRAVACLETIWLTPDSAGVALDDAMRVVGTRGSAQVDFIHAGLTLWRESGYLAPDVSYEPRVRGAVSGVLKEDGVFRYLRAQRQPPRRHG